MPKKTKVTVTGINKKYIKKNNTKKINYDLKNLKKNYKIFIKLGVFSTLNSATLMSNKLSYITNVKIHKIKKNGKFFFIVKSGPYFIVKKVDEMLSLLLSRGMQGAKIEIE